MTYVTPCCGSEPVYDCETEHVTCLVCDVLLPCTIYGCDSPAQHVDDAGDPLCPYHASVRPR